MGSGTPVLTVILCPIISRYLAVLIAMSMITRLIWRINMKMSMVMYIKVQPVMPVTQPEMINAYAIQIDFFCELYLP